MVKAYLCLSGFKVAGWFPEAVDFTWPVATGCGPGASAQGLFYIIHVIADSFGLRVCLAGLLL